MIDKIIRHEISLLSIHLENETIVDNLKNIVIGKYVREQLKANQNWIRAFVDGVICVESKGHINRSSVIKSSPKSQKLTAIELKGLRKVHIRIPGIENIVKQHSLESKIVSMEIQEEDIFILLKDIQTVKEMRNKRNESGEIIEKGSLAMIREKNFGKGDWLIYGTLDSVTHYLMIYTNKNHTVGEVDREILNILKASYPINYIENFLRKKSGK